MSGVTKSVQVFTVCSGLFGAGVVASFAAVNTMRDNQYKQAEIQKGLRN